MAMAMTMESQPRSPQRKRSVAGLTVFGWTSPPRDKISITATDVSFEGQNPFTWILNGVKVVQLKPPVFGAGGDWNVSALNLKLQFTETRTGHQLKIIIGPAGRYDVFVNHTIPSGDVATDGCALKDGDLVRLICFDRNRRPSPISPSFLITKGSIVFQYYNLAARQRSLQENLQAMKMLLGAQDDQDALDGPSLGPKQKKLDETAHPAAAVSMMKLDQVPVDALRKIFAFLPVEEVFVTIPAVCTRFLEAVATGCPLGSHGVVLDGRLPMPKYDIAFLLEWMNLARLQEETRPQSLHIKAGRLTEDGFWRRSVDIQVWAGAVLAKLPTWDYIELDVKHKLDEAVADRPCGLMREILLKSRIQKGLTVSGMPHLAVRHFTDETIVQPDLQRLRVNVTRMRRWVIDDGTAASELPVGVWAPNLKTVVVACDKTFEDREDLGILLHLLTPRGRARTMTRALKISAASVTRRRQLFQALEELAEGEFKGPLHALSVTMPGPYRRHGRYGLFRFLALLQPSLRVLHLATTAVLDDEVCVLIARRCPQLELLAVSVASKVTSGGVRAVLKRCPALRDLFLLDIRKEDGCLVPREDVLPANDERPELKKNLKAFKSVLSAIFD